ncbi:MAG: DUF4276 family protein [Magnetospirillum sp. WYHS-4]
MVAEVFVEGGGNKNLDIKLRQAFGMLADRAGLRGRMPKFVACGSRHEAYKDFVTALEHPEPGKTSLLLVDSEGPVSEESPWTHLGGREEGGWRQPPGATDGQCHFMVQAMESWFLADIPALRQYFGQDFKEKALPRGSIEAASKAAVIEGLTKAAKMTRKGGYDKGRDSFGILKTLDIAKVRAASPWADRFFTSLDKTTKGEEP